MYLNNKQSFTFGFIILALVFFIACEKTIETSKIIGYGTRVELKQTESIWFGADSLTGLKVTVTEIADSRCPEDVDCVWAGEAKVDLLAVQTQDSVNLKLTIDPTNSYKIDTLDFTLNSKNYKALLFAVDPYPSTKNEGAKFATLTVLQSN